MGKKDRVPVIPTGLNRGKVLSMSVSTGRTLVDKDREGGGLVFRQDEIVLFDRPVSIPGDIAASALFDRGFRPFFLLAGLWAPVALLLLLAMLAGILELPTAMDPVAWHVHEMLFGFVAAAISGFLLTAVPGWTGRPPLRGPSLAALAALWLAGRLAVALSAWIGAAVAAVVDIAFLAGLAAFCAREIAVGRNWRNLVVIALLAVLIAANALFHLGERESAERAAIATIVTLIALIGGRVVPEFTRNWLVRRGTMRLPAQRDRFDSAAMAATVAAALTWTLVGDHPLVGVSLGLAAAALAVRLARWRGLSTVAEPLLWVLHLGYLWLPVGLALLALSMLAPAVPQGVALHALTAGAMATMILAMMTRATLGHTGRPLTASRATAAIYMLVTVAASARLASGLADDGGALLLHASAAAWVAAFALFVLSYGPMLMRPRLDPPA